MYVIFFILFACSILFAIIPMIFVFIIFKKIKKENDETVNKPTEYNEAQTDEATKKGIEIVEKCCETLKQFALLCGDMIQRKNLHLCFRQ